MPQTVLERAKPKRRVLKLTAPVATEAQEQAAVIAWWQTYARSRQIDPRLLMASCNGAVLAGDAKHRAIQMARLKRMGLVVGTPDLFLAIACHGVHKERAQGADFHLTWPEVIFHGLFIEMKRVGAKATPDQIQMATLLRSQCYNVVIAEGFAEAQRAIMAYLGDAPASRCAQNAQFIR